MHDQDQTFFFFSYEGLRLDIPQSAVVTDVPTVAMRQQATGVLKAVLDSFPMPNGGDDQGLSLYTSGYSSPSTLDSSSIRIDRRFNDRFSVFGRFAYTPSSTTGRSSSDLANVVASAINVKSLTLGSNDLLTSRLDNEFRFNWTSTDSLSTNSLDTFGQASPFQVSQIPGLTGSNPQLYVYFSFGGLEPYLMLTPQTTQQQQVNVVDTMSESIGHYFLKWGVDYRRLSNVGLYPTSYEWPTFSSVDSVLNNTPSIRTSGGSIPG